MSQEKPTREEIRQALVRMAEEKRVLALLEGTTSKFYSEMSHEYWRRGLGRSFFSHEVKAWRKKQAIEVDSRLLIAAAEELGRDPDPQPA